MRKHVPIYTHIHTVHHSRSATHSHADTFLGSQGRAEAFLPFGYYPELQILQRYCIVDAARLLGGIICKISAGPNIKLQSSVFLSAFSLPASKTSCWHLALSDPDAVTARKLSLSWILSIHAGEAK